MKINTPTVILASVLLTACGVSYNIERMSSKDLMQPKSDGIAVRLAHSEIQATIVFDQLNYNDSNYKKLADYARLCKQTPDKQKESYDSFKRANATRYRIVSANAAVNGIAHGDKVFHLDIKAGDLSGFTHKFDLDEQGLIGAGSTTLENTSAVIATAVIKAAGTIGQTGFGFRQKAPTTKNTGKVIEFCNDTVPTLAKAAQSYQRKRASLAKDSHKAKSKLTKSMSKVDSSSLKLAFDVIDQPLIDFDKKNAGVVAKLTGAPNLTRYELTARFLPSEFEEAINAQFDRKDVSIKQIPLPGSKKTPPPASLSVTDALNDFLTIADPRVTVTPKSVTDHNLVKNCKLFVKKCVGPSTGGYPYRWPILSRIVVTANLAPHGTAAKRVDLITSRAVISQFGPVLRLPANIPGSKGNLDVTYHTGQSSLKSVTIGSTAISTATIDAAGTAIADILKARKESKAAEKAAAEAALAAENDALQREVDRLGLLKQKRDLEKELGIESGN